MTLHLFVVKSTWFFLFPLRSVCQCQWNLKSFWRLERIQVKRPRVSRVCPLPLALTEVQANDRTQIFPQSPREIWNQVLLPVSLCCFLGYTDILNWPWTKYWFCATLAQIHWPGILRAVHFMSIGRTFGWRAMSWNKEPAVPLKSQVQELSWSLTSESLISWILSDLVEFTDEEGYGRYLDLHDCYLKYINLKASEVGPRGSFLVLGVSQDIMLGLLDRKQSDYLPCVL